ncbi:acyltransferase [Granulicella sp. S190]|uniref:acyltransferase family protein n=1 Tax=Granulicella sp. S190 TaxID=1747226 RepID=UPI00131D3DBC|nr:acyltransferase [Granulicella sp. S190]
MSKSNRLQLDFIDGLRAVAALYIVVHHSLQAADYFPTSLYFMARGHDVVTIFIAISGFCLTLPLAQRGNWSIQASQFYRRRAVRILPPYYAAIAVGLLFAAVYSYKSYLQDYGGAPITLTLLMSHLFLVQNWIPDQRFTLDGPLWSIAVECQIYLLFPLLLWLWRRGGKRLLLAVSFVVAHAVFYAAHHVGSANYLFIFTLGMLGAELAFSESSGKWLGITFLSSAMAYVISIRIARTPVQISDILVGLSTVLLMAYLTRNREHWGNKVLGWKPFAWVGTFSYSLYLVHSFVLSVVRRWFLGSDGGHLRSGKMAVLMVFVAGPLAVASSYGFHMLFERPFISRNRQRVEHRLAS